jgi:hypothetical protein
MKNQQWLVAIWILGQCLSWQASAGLVTPAPSVPLSGAYDQGYLDGYTIGHEEGRLLGREQCRVDPVSCSIALANVLPPADYGETEPNNTRISADPLALNANFWGQSHNVLDQDWYYLVTGEQNVNLTVNFSLPEADTTDLSGWTVSIQNAAGIVIAEFDSGFTTVEHANAGITYRTTLGLAGTYYVLVRPNTEHFNFQPYNLAISLTPSLNGAPNFVGGVYDAETEPNNVPGNADWLHGHGVAMFGLVNLRFDSALCNATECVYGQDEDDWYIYNSPGHEIIELSFCTHTPCSEGDWLVQVYDAVTADAIQWGRVAIDDAQALVTFNTATQETIDGNPRVWNIGLDEPGAYFVRIGHKRTLRAPCVAWQRDMNNDGIPELSSSACSCTSGDPVCDIDIMNPGAPYIGTEEQVIWPVCPDGTGGGQDVATCETSCLAVQNGLFQTDPDGDGIPGPNAQACQCIGQDTVSCTVTAQNPGSPTVVTIPDQELYPLCPDGSGGDSNTQCTIGCLCTETSGEVSVPETEVTSQYNFSWNSTLVGTP